MSRFSVVLLIILFVTIAPVSAQQMLQDVVYLSNGSIIRGTILEQVPDKLIRIQTADGSMFIYSIKDIIKITKEPYLTTLRNASKKKEPVVAFLMSFVIPGAGQLYNGKSEYSKGAIQFVGALIGWAFIFADEDAYVDGNYRYHGPNHYARIGTIFVGASWIWSFIDAPISAERINREAEVAVKPLNSDNGIGVKLAFRF